MESNIPLPIRVESSNPRDIRKEWHRMLRRPSYGNRIMTWIEAICTEYEVKTTTKEERVRGYLAQRWNSLIDELKQAEPHSIHNYVAALKRIGRYIHIGRTKGILWLPLTFQPPILLWPVPNFKGYQYGIAG